jgi:hypothetical protein
MEVIIGPRQCLILRGYYPKEGLPETRLPLATKLLNIMLSLCTRFWRADTCRQPFTENASVTPVIFETTTHRNSPTKIDDPRTQGRGGCLSYYKTKSSPDQDLFCSLFHQTQRTGPHLPKQSSGSLCPTLCFYSHFVYTSFAMFNSCT